MKDSPFEILTSFDFVNSLTGKCALAILGEEAYLMSFSES